MNETYNIKSIENFNGSLPIIEISDISKLISEMINIKNDSTRLTPKKIRPYDINEKAELNSLSENLKAKICKHHIDLYDIVEDAINCKEEYEASIRSDLYDYYWDVYMDTLIELQISHTNYEKIKQESDNIYTSMIKLIDKQIFAGKQTTLESNKKITYLGAITAYVFYKCKFLIPIDSDPKV